MNNTETVISQIMPAEGWFAFYKSNDDEVLKDRVVCFALTTVVNGKNSVQEVKPMVWADGDIDFADSAQNFSHIAHERDGE